MSYGIRLIGNAILIGGIITLLKSQLMEITIAPDYANIDINTIPNLPERVVNLDLIATKTNYTLLAGLLILIGLQLSLVSNKISSEIKEQWDGIFSNHEKSVSVKTEDIITKEGGDVNNQIEFDKIIKQINNKNEM